MSDSSLLAYFAAICGVLSMVAPILSNTVSRFIFGSVFGIIAITSWPVAKAILG